MKILVTGLCLQGNKGGLAIALTLMRQIRKHIPRASFAFSVPPGRGFKYEIVHSRKYGVEVLEDYSVKVMIPPFIFYPLLLKRIIIWFKKLSEVDLVIDMSAISYVGWPIGTIKSILFGGRFKYFISTLLFKKPFLAWTQSYGPLSPKIVRYLARIDLRKQPIVFCRGDDCSRNVRGLLPGKKIFSFPDVAALLEYNHGKGVNYVRSIIPDINFEKLVTVSASAVIFQRTGGISEGNRHIQEMVDLCRCIVQGGRFVLLVPHVFRPNCHVPGICDYAVSQVIFKRINNPDKVAIVHEDLSPIDLKSIISTAYVHIGARYHSIVASLSSGVPTISLSWHPKYKDIMRIYGCEKYVYNEINDLEPNELCSIFSEVCKYRHEISRQLIEIQKDVMLRIEQNTLMFIDCIKEVLI